MILRNDIIERIKGRKDIVPLIAAEMNVSRATVNTWLDRNKPDGWLTTFKVLAILRDKFTLTDEQLLANDIINQTKKSDGKPNHNLGSKTTLRRSNNAARN